MLAVLFCGCAEQNAAYEVTVESICAELNEKRAAAVNAPLEHTVKDFGTADDSFPKDFTDEEVRALVTSRSYKSELTLEEALEDTDTLMRVFKTSYAGYCYFGGDESFSAAHERINCRLNEAYADGKEKQPSTMLQDILLEELFFIEDSHLSIGRKNTAFKEKYIFFEASEMEFHRDDCGLYTEIKNKKFYLDERDEQYIRLTTGADGMPVYGLFALTDDETSLPNEFSLTSRRGKKTSVPVEWSIADAGTPDKRVHNYSEIDGIPVTSLGRMSVSSEDIHLTNDFINRAAELRNEKVFILDLRSNVGGLTHVNDFFMYNLTGSRCCYKCQMVKRYSPLNLWHNKVNNDYLGGTESFSAFEQLDFFKENRELVRSWYSNIGSFLQRGKTSIRDVSAVMTPYENTIIVLIDKNTVSAGEYLLYELSTVNNVIIMGTNSAGCLITGDVNILSGVYLPNSGMTLYYGQTLMLSDGAEGYDSNGFMPDVISRRDALADAVALAKTIK